MDPDAGVDAMPDTMTGMPSIEGTPVMTFETTSCSTNDVLALSLQIAQEVECIAPGGLVEFEEGDNIEFTGVVLPYMSMGGREDMYAAVAAGGGTKLRINSAYRTVVQQYLLYRWGDLGRCNISVVATPGNSPHESGRALDVQNYGDWVTLLEANNWDHYGPGDLVHFTHLPSPANPGQTVLAFQRLWNRNAPDDQIDEDGIYGPQTEARVKMAPAEGFGLGAQCDSARRIRYVLPRAPVAERADAVETCGH